MNIRSIALPVTLATILSFLFAAVVAANGGGPQPSGAHGNDVSGGDDVPAWASEEVDQFPGLGGTGPQDDRRPQWSPVSLADGSLAHDGKGRYLLVDVDAGIRALGLVDGTPPQAITMDDGGAPIGAAGAIRIADYIDEFKHVGAVRSVLPGDPLIRSWCSQDALRTGACLFDKTPLEANRELQVNE